MFSLSCNCRDRQVNSCQVTKLQTESYSRSKLSCCVVPLVCLVQIRIYSIRTFGVLERRKKSFPLSIQNVLENTGTTRLPGQVCKLSIRDYKSGEQGETSVDQPVHLPASLHAPHQFKRAKLRTFCQLNLLKLRLLLSTVSTVILSSKPYKQVNKEKTESI